MSEENKHGIVELKEALDASLALGVVLTGALKDGAQLEDLSTLWNALSSDQGISDKLQKAWDGATNIGDEIGDLSLEEGVELAGLMLGYVSQFVEALSSK